MLDFMERTQFNTDGPHGLVLPMYNHFLILLKSYFVNGQITKRSKPTNEELYAIIYGAFEALSEYDKVLKV